MMESLRIAVADDERDMRDYLKAVLERLGHQVLGPVQNGLELVELCRREMPDLIITDVRMPELDGDAALREICAERPTPFIVITAYGLSETMSDELHIGSGEYLNKPVRKADLVTAIDKITLDGHFGSPD